MSAITQTSREITKINRAIDEIAFQTNILALNAAVEAARAGQAGTGFAVVADEVRNLAARSADAAKRASELIERSHEAVSRGGSLAEHVTATLSTMDLESRQVTEVIEQIALASSEQAQGISSVAAASRTWEESPLSRLSTTRPRNWSKFAPERLPLWGGSPELRRTSTSGLLRVTHPHRGRRGRRHSCHSCRGALLLP